MSANLTLRLDFTPVADGAPDDDTAVFLLLDDCPDDPLFIGYLDAGIWYFSDGSPVNAGPGAVTHWAHKPGRADLVACGCALKPVAGGNVGAFLAHLERSGMSLADLMRPMGMTPDQGDAAAEALETAMAADPTARGYCGRAA